MKTPNNRMQKNGRKRTVVADMPPEGTPVEMVAVPKEIMKCPRCGTAKHGQWEMIKTHPSGTYYWCRSCGSKVVKQDGRVFVIG